MVNDSALRLQAATKIRPKMVEDQSGSSDITQSIVAKVIEKISSASPGPLIICKRLRILLLPVRSCSSENQFSASASKDQNAK
jgi:hypothetical protein